jgi:hypothetical protein
VLVLFPSHQIVKNRRARVLVRPETSTIPPFSRDLLLEGAVLSDRLEDRCASCE